MNKIILVIFFACCAFGLGSGGIHRRQKPVEGCVIYTEGGAVRGYIRHAEKDFPYLSFRGVPYAQQPVGPLRFKPLQPVLPWKGVRDALDEGPVCPQRDLVYGPLMRPQSMSESCIHANVHVPIPTDNCSKNLGEAVRRQKLPVFVWIHGGGFSFGSGDADVNGPEYLMSKKVIVVTFNYRLAALGFLSMGTKDLPGNLGLRDQVAMLEWVQRNIAAFGGDPDNVTVGGQSAGASSTQLLTLSPLAKGLFHRAIMMSGSASRSFFTSSPLFAQTALSMFARELNITSTDHQVVLDQLISASVEDIISATLKVQGVLGLTVFPPVIEGRYEGIKPFLDEDPYEIIRSGRAANIPMIIGFTDSECQTFARNFEEFQIVEKLRATNGAVLAPIDLAFKLPQAVIAERMLSVVDRYFDGDLSSNDTFDKFITYCSDNYFRYPAIKMANLLSEMPSSKIYLYEFAYDGDYDVLRRATGQTMEGAAHIVDMLYVLKANSFSETIKMGSVDEWIKDWMTTMFTNFITTSTPTSQSQINWTTTNSVTTPYLEVDEVISMKDRPYPEMVDFFDRLYEPEPALIDNNNTTD